MRGAGRSIEDSHARFNHWSDGQHDFFASNHAATILQQLHGHVGSVLHSAENDPAIFAYQLRDRLPEMEGYVRRLREWSDTVIESDPYGVPVGRAV